MSQGIDHGDDARAVWYALVIEGNRTNAAAARVLDIHRSVTNRWKRGRALARAEAAYQTRSDNGELSPLVRAYIARHEGREAGEAAAEHLHQAGRATRDVPTAAAISDVFAEAVVHVADTGCEPAIALMACGVPRAEAEEWVRCATEEGIDAEQWTQMTTALALWEVERRTAIQRGDRGGHMDLLRTTLPERYTPRERVELEVDPLEDEAARFDQLSAAYAGGG